ncbi:hypothetical protein V5E97_20015 [Singulisphaera sp. Ch08]|uniref:Uncharacterized protein n=1 Tax=Singulisphaera sp. Ch08 TaxID=3120278 RepID=A0AAU7CSR3_9BACT
MVLGALILQQLYDLTDQLIKVIATDTSKQHLDSTAIQSVIRSLPQLMIPA